MQVPPCPSRRHALVYIPRAYRVVVPSAKILPGTRKREKDASKWDNTEPKVNE